MLDALRDAMRDAAVDVVAVFNPDRLARENSCQVLFLEELRRAGYNVVFLACPIAGGPNARLLLQIQRAIAGELGPYHFKLRERVGGGAK